MQPQVPFEACEACDCQMKRKKVAIYLPSLRGGGAERVMVGLANGIAARGYEVDIVLARAEGPYLADVSRHVRLVDLGATRVIASLPGLVRYLRRERPEAMLSALNYANVVAIIARGLAQVSTRLVVSEHSNISLSKQFSRGLIPRLVFRLMAWVYPYADGIVAVSSGVADDLAQVIGMARDRIKVVYNPIYTPAVESLSKVPIPHPWLGADLLPVVIGMGRLTLQKDFRSMIHAFDKVRKQHPCRLMILGEGDLRGELEVLVKALNLDEEVIFPGFVKNPYAYMSRAALFVLSSGWEGFGNVLAEAMACGCPVVSTDCPSGPAEILEDGKRGRLVPVGDVDALAAAILATLKEDDHPDVVSRARDFGVEQAVVGYLDVLGMQV